MKLAGWMRVAVVLAAAGFACAEDDPVDKAGANPTSTGLLIVEVLEDSPAASAGLEPGDILTSYNGKPVASNDELKAAMEAADLPEKVKVEVDREGKGQGMEVPKGQMGVVVVAVKKGEALKLPPATDVTFDFSRLEKGGEAWYSFSEDGTHKAGFEHYTWKVQDGKATFENEFAFDTGEEGGLTHFAVTEVVALAAHPQGVSSHLESVIDKSTQGWDAPAKGPVDDVVPQYFVYALARCMPRKKGACWHFTPVDESTGKTARASALLAVGEEKTKVGDKEVPTWRIEWSTLGQVESTLWVDADGNVVRMDYGGSVATTCSKEEALKDLNPQIHPRTAK